MSQTAVKKIKSHQAYEKIKAIIDQGKLAPGERVTETRIAALLGMSRGTIRESLLRLEAEGVLKYRGNRLGRYVEYFEDQNLPDLLRRYELRECIEAGAARLAAMNMNGWQIEELRAIARVLHEAMKRRNLEARKTAGRQYHDYLMTHCGNPLFREARATFNLAPVVPRSEALNARILSNLRDEPGHNRKLLEVVEAIGNHDPDGADRHMRGFVREIIDAIKKFSQAQSSS